MMNNNKLSATGGGTLPDSYFDYSGGPNYPKPSQEQMSLYAQQQAQMGNRSKNTAFEVEKQQYRPPDYDGDLVSSKAYESLVAYMNSNIESSQQWRKEAETWINKHTENLDGLKERIYNVESAASYWDGKAQENLNLVGQVVKCEQKNTSNQFEDIARKIDALNLKLENAERSQNKLIESTLDKFREDLEQKYKCSLDLIGTTDRNQTERNEEKLKNVNNTLETLTKECEKNTERNRVNYISIIEQEKENKKFMTFMNNTEVKMAHNDTNRQTNDKNIKDLFRNQDILEKKIGKSGMGTTTEITGNAQKKSDRLLDSLQQDINKLRGELLTYKGDTNSIQEQLENYEFGMGVVQECTLLMSKINEDEIVSLVKMLKGFDQAKIDIDNDLLELRGRMTNCESQRIKDAAATTKRENNLATSISNTTEKVKPLFSIKNDLENSLQKALDLCHDNAEMINDMNKKINQEIIELIRGAELPETFKKYIQERYEKEEINNLNPEAKNTQQPQPLEHSQNGDQAREEQNNSNPQNDRKPKRNPQKGPAAQSIQVDIVTDALDEYRLTLQELKELEGDFGRFEEKCVKKVTNRHLQPRTGVFAAKIWSSMGRWMYYDVSGLYIAKGDILSMMPRGQVERGMAAHKDQLQEDTQNRQEEQKENNRKKKQQNSVTDRAQDSNVPRDRGDHNEDFHGRTEPRFPQYRNQSRGKRENRAPLGHQSKNQTENTKYYEGEQAPVATQTNLNNEWHNVIKKRKGQNERNQYQQPQPQKPQAHSRNQNLGYKSKQFPLHQDGNYNEYGNDPREPRPTMERAQGNRYHNFHEPRFYSGWPEQPRGYHYPPYPRY